MDINRNRNIIRPLTLVPALFLTLVVTGCATVGPDYVPPEISSSQAWHAGLEGGLTKEKGYSIDLSKWWKRLDDPVLSGLIDRTIKGNLDLKEAYSSLREARAQRGISRSDRFPTLDVSGSATKSRSKGDEQDLFAIDFDAGWELDLFGGVQRSLEAAERDLQASRENLRDVLVSLTAEVALNYIEVRTGQARLASAETNLAIQQETYQLIQSRFQAGLDDELTVQQARYNLESTRSEIPTLRTSLEEAKNRLAVLLGEQPGVLHKELDEQRPIPVPPLKVAVGVPADMLRRRPDVRKAERELAAQTARVGVATADLYPKITLNGSIGLESVSTGNLFSSGSRFYSFGPRITCPIFDAGAIRNNIEVQSAVQEQKLIKYESAVLTALEEVENALVAYAEEQNRKHALDGAVQAAERATEMARIKYQTGLIDFADLLDAQRSLNSYQDQLAQSNGSVTSNLVRLYKALGGGWDSMLPGQEQEL
jgi:NodT family efflux transporter outer membrane factor (OMF) lipoprotein